ncbi:MAG: hypothetical protein QXU40_00050 [Candidatus Pacearchaeota archaeon]
MDAKRISALLTVFMSILLFATSISARDIADNVRILVNGVDVGGDVVSITPLSVVSNELIVVEVRFDSLINSQNIYVEIELETKNKNIVKKTKFFNVEEGKRYVQSLSIEVPFDLEDTLSDFAHLTITIKGRGVRDDFGPYKIRVQRESYKVEFVSLNAPKIINSGDIVPVDIVFRNIGYNDLKDLFVKARIPALGIEQTSFIGDLIALKCDKDATPEENWGINISRKCWESKETTKSIRFLFEIPNEAKSGRYALEIEVVGEKAIFNKVYEIEIMNKYPAGNFIVSGNQLLIINPTNEIKVYRIVPQSTSEVSVRVSEYLVAIPPYSSKSVTVEAESKVSSQQKYFVSILTPDDKVVETLEFTKPPSSVKEATAFVIKTAEGGSSNLILVITILLAIIFIILVVVLIVLLTKKPEKEEFGESYY